jgi:DNA-binding transcriptional LysR family regulator
VLKALEAVGRRYRIVASSSSLAALKTAVKASLGVSAFARYVMPDGIIRSGQFGGEIAMSTLPIQVPRFNLPSRPDNAYK